MGLPQEKPAFTRSDYLAWENEQPDRHEFVAGEVFAMTGVRDVHNVIAGNFYLALRQHLKGSSCKTYMADVKLEVVAVDSVFYPDVFVTCESPSDPLIKRDASLIVEVLSPSTEAYDRGRKFAAYRMLGGLKEYILVTTDEPHIEVFSRADDGAWLLREYRPGDFLTLSSVDLTCAVDDIYDDVDFSETAPAATL